MTPEKSKEKILVTPKEAAALLGVKPSAMGRYVTEGKLAAWRTPGGLLRVGDLRFDRAEVLKLAESLKVHIPILQDSDTEGN